MQDQPTPADRLARFQTPLATREQAEDFFRYLYENNLAYHPEDSAAEIISHATQLPMFTRVEAEALDARTAEAYSFDWGDTCPCGFILSLDPDAPSE